MVVASRPMVSARIQRAVAEVAPMSAPALPVRGVAPRIASASQRPRPSVFARAQEQQQPRTPEPSPAPAAAAAVAQLAPASSLDDAAELPPYLEPLLRNLVLGASAGALAELAHALISASSGAGASPAALLGRLLAPMLAAAQSMPGMDATGHSGLSPLFMGHAVAFGVWALLYCIEAATVSRILDEHPGQPGEAARTIRSTPTLPKRMLPAFSLPALKRKLFAALSAGTRAAGATAGAGASASASASPATTSAPASASDSVSAFSGPSRAGSLGRSGSLHRSGSLLPAGSSSLDRQGSTASSGALGRAGSSSGAVLDRPEQQTKRQRSLGGSGLRPIREEGTGLREGKREKELRERKQYLKNFWYVAALSQDVKKGQTKEVKMLGRTVVLFRDEEGKVKCMENNCPHRGAPLSKGWVSEVKGKSCVVCPYHAWAIDGEGRLQDVPAATKGALPKRPVVEAYPVEERGGFVWLFFGSKNMPAAERPPIPVIPELESDNWQAVYGEMEFDAPHWSTFDNALDFAHIHYVHGSSFGNPDKPEIMDMELERDSWSMKGSFKIHNKPVNKLWEWTRVPYVPVEVRAFLPMTSAVRITLGFGVQMITFVNTVPINENRSVNRFCLIRNFATSPLFDSFVKREMFKILGEDKEIVETVQPDEMPFEMSLEPDLPQVLFRKLRQEWIDMGYGVDPKTTKGPKGTLNQ